MTDKVREMAPVILEAVKKANNILLHCHPSPDPDSVGSALAMMHVLRGMGKAVTLISGDSERPIACAFLPGFDQIQEKSYFDIDINEFDLFIIQDSASEDMISKLQKVVLPENLNTIVIDHHLSNRGFGKINLVDSAYVAVCELLYDMYSAWEIEISNEVARCLLLGIYTDSGGFKYPPTNKYTFRMVASLVNINPDYSQDIFEFENNNSPERLLAIGLALTHIKTYFGGRVAISVVSYQDYQKNGISKKDTEKLDIANQLKSVVGWDLAVSLGESEKEVVGIGLRTRNVDEFDLTKLALALNGGGHKAAAGAVIEKSLDEAIKMVLEAIQKVYPKLGKP